MLYARKNGGPAELLPFEDRTPDGSILTDLEHEPESRAALGWEVVSAPPAALPGHQFVWSQDAEGWVQEELPAVRDSLRKSVVVNRLIEAGKIGDAMSALMASPAAFARWTAPDWPEVYRDDPDVLAMLTAIGADATQILAPA